MFSRHQQNFYQAILRMIAGLAATYILSAIAWAQDDSPENLEYIASALTRAVETQARTALERHLRPEEFQAFAKVIPAAGQVPVPYLPDRIAPIGDPNTPIDTLKSLIKSIELEIFISDQYDAKAKSIFKDIVWKRLSLNAKRGDTVVFTALGLKVEKPSSVSERDLVRSEADARELKSQLDVLKREREDAKREASEAKRDLATTKTELEKANTTKAEGLKPESGAPQAKSAWREFANLIVGSIAVILILVVSMMVARGAVKSLSQAVQSIGTGLPQLGEKIGESLERSSQAAIPVGHAARDPGDLQIAARNSGGNGLPIEAVAKQLVELSAYLSKAVDETNKSMILEYLSYLLEDDTLISRAVATMELLDKEKANLLYNSLSLSNRQKIFTFLRTGSHGRPKGEALLEAGEALKTKLWGSVFSNRMKLGEEVSQKLLLLGMDDQIAVASSLDGPSLSRLFLYFEPAKIGTILSGIRDIDAKRFDRAALLVVKIPEVETASNLDSAISTAIESQLARTTADVQGPYLSYYRTIIESVDAEVAESLVAHFAAANPRVEKFIQETLVTFGTFFKLQEQIQESIISAMTNKDLAALVSGLPPERKAVIYSHIEDRRKEIIDEDTAQLTSNGPREALAAHRAAKQQIVKKIGQLRGGRPLIEMLAQETARSENAAA